MITPYPMMKLFAKRGIWYVRIPGKGRTSLKTRDKELATTIRNRLKKQILRGNVRALEAEKNISLKAFIDEYLKHCKTHKGPATYERYAYDLKRLVDWVGNPPLKAVTTKILDDFYTDLLGAYSESGTAITYRSIRAAFNKAVEWGYLRTSPHGRVSPIRVPKSTPRFYSKVELQRIFQEIQSGREPADFLDMIRLYLYTGLRRSELFTLETKDVDFDTGLLTVRGKTGQRTVPMQPIVRNILAPRCRKYPTGSLWRRWHHPNAITHRWIRLMERIGLTGRLHDLRHSFASHLAMKGESIQTISELLGHQSITTTQIYSHLSPGHLQRAVESLNDLETVERLKVVK